MLFCSDEEAERNLEEQRERYTPFITELQYTGIQVKTTLDTFKLYYLVAEVPGVARVIITKSNFYFFILILDLQALQYNENRIEPLAHAHMGSSGSDLILA